MKKILTLLMLVTNFLYAIEGSVGAGFQVISPIQKQKNKNVTPIPILDFENKYFYIRGTNLGLNLYTETDFSFSLFMNPLDAYFSGFSVSSNDMKDGYDRIDDRDPGVIGGVLFSLGNFNEIYTNISYAFGEHGDKLNVNFAKNFVLNDRFSIVPSIYANYYLKRYTDYYFGISKSEVIKNTKISSEYSPDSSYSIGFSVTSEYFTTEYLNILCFLGIDYFDKEISDSPIVEKNNSFYYGMGFRYSL